jgi:uncharacterized protein
VRVELSEDAEFTLSLRVPAWAEGATLRVLPAGDEAADAVPVAPGTAEVRRAFRAGDVVELALPLQPRVVRADPRVDAVRGCVAIERGPEVLALESVDLAGAPFDDVADAVIDLASPPVRRDGRVWVRLAARVEPDARWPYTPDVAAPAGDVVEAPLVPYHDWANRGPSTMRIWIPTT